MTISFRVEDGEPTLEHDGIEYRGRQIHQERTTLGPIVSVRLDELVTLGLAIPEARCPNDMRSIPLQSFVVISKADPSLGSSKPATGQLRDHRVVPVTGNGW